MAHCPFGKLEQCIRVLDLGCGFGWFCRFAHEQGAAQVLGLDVSENMLTQARSMTSASTIAYEQADLENFELPEKSFDLAFSSLTFHYIENNGGLFASVHRALAPDANFVASMEHPIYMSPTRPGW